MEKLVKRLRAALAESFPKAQLDLESPDEPDEKISGFLIWAGFEGQDQLDRQSAVWKVLRERLSPEERRFVSAVFTMTPDEMVAVREG